MDPSLYIAAKEGKIDVLKQKEGQLKDQVTPNNNTVLHIAALFGRAQCVGEILKMNSSLLCRANVKGDTALHVAVREGFSEVVDELIKCAKAPPDVEQGSGSSSSSQKTKELIRATNEDGDTAFHDAVRNHDHGVAELLIGEDPEITVTVNGAGETPLYLAAEVECNEIVSGIVKNCPLVAAYDGPDGRTALHASVIWDNEVSTKNLLAWKKDLAEKPDKFGWRPLHYAARFGHVLRVKQLLEGDKSIAYLTTTDEDDKKTALHVAATQGHVGVMEELISQCPDCWEMVNGKGQNILHVAAENERPRVIAFIIKNSSLSSLLNQKDNKGNTPLHVLAAAGYLAHVKRLMRHPRVDKRAFNKENLNPIDIVAKTSVNKAETGFIITRRRSGGALGRRNVINKDKEVSEKKKEARDKKHRRDMKRDPAKTGEAHLIVAALVATVTFAAGFTVPGGYDSNAGKDQGMAILTREAAFKAFVVTNTIAMLLSTAAVFTYFYSTALANQYHLEKYLTIAGVLVATATGSMVVAFITGSYAALANSSSLAISICVIACVIALVVAVSIYALIFQTVTGLWPGQLIAVLTMRLNPKPGTDVRKKADRGQSVGDQEEQIISTTS